MNSRNPSHCACAACYNDRAAASGVSKRPALRVIKGGKGGGRYALGYGARDMARRLASSLRRFL